ncbi:MAG: glycosyltransferase family 39 protein [Caldilineaceae bacterium]
MHSDQSPNLPISNLQSLWWNNRISNLPWESLILLIALLVRLWRINSQSFWFDEAVSLDWAQRPLWQTWTELMTFVQDKHPPFYYILLHGWMQLLRWFGLGQSDAALRLLGVLLGTLTVLGVLQLGLWTTKRNVALLTGLLVALSPLLIWYSQELRMFQLATAAIIWSAYFLVRAWYAEGTAERLRFWVGMILTLEIALYSYLFSAFILPAAGITLLGLWIVQRRGREFVEGVLALGVTTLLFLPLARNAWQVSGEEAVAGRPFQDFLANQWNLLRVFTIWRVSWPSILSLAALLCFSLLFMLGLIAILAKRKAAPDVDHAEGATYAWDYDDDDPLRFLPLIWLGVPLLIANLLLVKDQTIFAEDRYLLFLVPFLLWIVAEGVVWLWTLVRHKRLTTLPHHYPFAGVGGLLVAGILAASLPSLSAPSLARENWRAAADYILEIQQANPNLRAAVVAHVDYTRLPLQWYLRKAMTETELPLYFPFGGTLTPEQIEPAIAPPLQGIADLGIDTIWLTESHLEGVDDGRLVENWLAQHFALITEQFPNGIKLSGYALRTQYKQLPQLSIPASHLQRELIPGLTLAACEIVNPQTSAQDETMHPPSGWVHVRLWWQATDKITEDYIASVQMVGEEGVWGERLYRSNEALRRWPTSSWNVGDIVRDEIDVNLNPVTPANQYPIVVGVKNAADQSIGEKVECGKVQID